MAATRKKTVKKKDGRMYAVSLYKNDWPDGAMDIDSVLDTFREHVNYEGGSPETVKVYRLVPVKTKVTEAVEAKLELVE